MFNLHENIHLQYGLCLWTIFMVLALALLLLLGGYYAVWEVRRKKASQGSSRAAKEAKNGGDGR